VARKWGFWTRYKLELLERYLDAFTTTTKYKASKTVYLDLFGGEPENVDRDTLSPIDGSARIALKDLSVIH
jgi:three-Cys-motif partner protein